MPWTGVRADGDPVAGPEGRGSYCSAGQTAVWQPGRALQPRRLRPANALDSLGWKLEMIDRNKGRVLTETGLLGECVLIYFDDSVCAKA